MKSDWADMAAQLAAAPPVLLKPGHWPLGSFLRPEDPTVLPRRRPLERNSPTEEHCASRNPSFHLAWHLCEHLSGCFTPGDVVVKVDPRYHRPTEVQSLLGDPSKARDVLGWSPRITFSELVREMVRQTSTTHCARTSCARRASR